MLLKYCYSYDQFLENVVSYSLDHFGINQERSIFLYFTVVDVELPNGDYIDILVTAVNSLTEISAILLGKEYKVS